MTSAGVHVGDMLLFSTAMTMFFNFVIFIVVLCVRVAGVRVFFQCVFSVVFCHFLTFSHCRHISRFDYLIVERVPGTSRLGLVRIIR